MYFINAKKRELSYPLRKIFNNLIFIKKEVTSKSFKRILRECLNLCWNINFLFPSIPDFFLENSVRRIKYFREEIFLTKDEVRIRGNWETFSFWESKNRIFVLLNCI